MAPFAILLPPSMGKAEGGDGPPWRPGTLALPALDDARAQLLTQPLAGAPTLRALDRYTGVLYGELDAGSLPATARRRLLARTLVFSAPWGAVGLGDPIPADRLTFEDRIGDSGRLAAWWRPRLTAALKPRLRGRVVWDLLPAQHSAAWSPADVPFQRRFTVKFVTAQGKTVSHWNKLLKGALVRYLVTDDICDPAALSDFDHPQGYRFDPSATAPHERGAELIFRES